MIDTHILHDVCMCMHAGVRKELTFTDSLSLLDVDNQSMAEISRLMKLLKPLEFYMASLKVRSHIRYAYLRMYISQYTYV